jgi:hypothetical protein
MTIKKGWDVAGRQSQKSEARSQEEGRRGRDDKRKRQYGRRGGKI